jgi:hypothetical protein
MKYTKHLFETNFPSFNNDTLKIMYSIEMAEKILADNVIDTQTLFCALSQTLLNISNHSILPTGIWRRNMAVYAIVNPHNTAENVFLALTM